jgi:hypothetical protein
VINFSFNSRQEIRQSEKRLASKAYAYAFGYADRVADAGERKRTSKARRAKAARYAPGSWLTHNRLSSSPLH